MKKIMKRITAVVLAMVLLFGAAPAMGIVGIGDWLTVQASAKTIGEYAVGDHFEFGWYPQSEVTDTNIIADLNAAPQTWQSYGYYTGTGNWADGQMTASDYMQYCDAILDGVKYRGVKFTQHRPYYTSYTSSYSSYQDKNGYYTGTTYWFRYAPLEWRVLDPDTGLVLCETVIDSQPYNNYVLESGKDENNYPAYWGDAGKTHYANNYAESSLRRWLNEDFYNTAFSPAQQDIIRYTVLDNRAYLLFPAYDSVSTTDKVFLLSYGEALNTAYGFDAGYIDPARQAQGTDYAKCQGLQVVGKQNAFWWLRSASSTSHRACCVEQNGWVESFCYTCFTGGGIRPALKLNLTSAIFQSDASDLVPSHNLSTVTVEPTCTESGSKVVTCSHCDYRREDILPARGHDRQTTIVNATCTKAGYKIIKCVRCGEIFDSETYDRLPHQYDAFITAQTATKGGYTTYTCSMCGRKVTAHETPPTGSPVYTLTFHANGGAVQGQATYSKTYSKGNSITKPTPVRSGYSFAAWYPTLPSTMPDYDLTAYAVWKPDHVHETTILNQSAPTCDTAGQTGIVYCETCAEILDFGSEIPAAGHAWDNGAVTTDATCLETGIQTFTCKVCKTTRDEMIPAWGHCYDNGFNSVEPTCLEEGEKTFTCAACGETYTEPVPAAGHDFDDGIITTAATCTEDGIKTFTCTRCNTETYTEPVPAKGHSIDNGVVTTESTCTEDGIKTFSCSRCHIVLDTEPVPAKGHSIDDGVVTTESTCTEDGIKTFSCSRCHIVLDTELVSATGHSFDNGAVTTEPTCTEEGVKTFTCTLCNTEQYTEAIPSLGHNYDKGVVTTEPKCAEEGIKTFTCSRCGGTYTEPVPELGHKYTFAIETLPTCTEDGAMRYTCTVCGDSYLSPIKAAHKYNAVITEPTCTEQGYTTYTCSACGDSYVDHYTDPAHKYEDTITEPTCVLGGFTTHTCSVCGESYTDTETKPAGHQYKKKVVYPSAQSGGSVTYTCAVCGKVYAVQLGAYDTIEFGSYPQTRVTDPEIVNTFIAEAKSGVYVTSYRYLYGSSNDNLTNGSMKSYDFMVYWDSYYGNEKYRIVYFNQYRPISTGGRPQENSSWQPDNGYYVNNYYVFKWEPLRWKVLDAEKGLVICESIIDAQPFNNYIISKTVNNKKVYYGEDGTSYANNYAKSPIRKWLNSMGTSYDDPNYLPSFYINAFDEDEQACIKPTTLDNTGSYSNHPEYNCESTTDKVFLLSYWDVINPKYGFNADPDARREDSGRLATATDYAKCQGLGVCVSEDESYKHWKLRNGTWDSDIIGEVLFYGMVGQSGATYETTEGIRPAMTLDLAALGIDQTNPPDHTYDDGVVLKEATCTESGKRVDCCLVCGDTREVITPAKGHNYTANVLATEDCTNNGEVEYTCSVCGETHTKDVPALGHDYVQTIQAVTCTEDGVTTYTCSRCGDSYTEDIVPATGHRFESVVVNATCTEDGYTASKCANCQTEKDIVVIPKLGHDYDAVITTPTCESDGFTTFTCQRCGHSYTGDEKAALGHDWKEHIVKEATCTEAGEKSFECRNNSEHTRTETIPAKGHSYEAVVTAPTCESKGFTTHTCAVCGDSYTTDEKAEIGHDWDSGAVTLAATCTTEGIRTFTCKHDATHTYTAPIAALGHEYIVTVIPPTCEEKGYTAHACIRCESRFTTDEKPATGHVWNSGRITKAATCTEDGVRTFTCTHDSSHTRTETIPATGHSFGTWVQTKAPTVYAEGEEQQTCSKCGEKNTKSIPKLPMPKVVIQNFTSSSKAYDYRSTVTFKATVENPLSGGQIHWFVDGKDVGTGESYTAENVKQGFSLQAKYYVDGKEIPEAATETEKVNVNTGFFAKLKAFFRGLFGKLPKVVQEYLGIEIIDRILPD